mgnify:CR=1 FL=1
MSDRRDQQLHFRVSKPELERIRNKMESSGILSIGSYLRKMALDGYCLYLDLPQLRRMAYLLQMCSNNLNQYAKVANENGRVYAADMEDLRARLCSVIDNILAEKPKDYEGFLQRLEQQGYEVKRGKYTSVKGARQKRFIRFRTLGAGYGEEELKAVLAGEAEHRPRQKCPAPEQKFQMLVDIQAKLAEGKGTGFARWAKQHNLKEISRTLIFLQENKIGSIEEMQERVDAATARYHELGDSIKASEKRLAEIAVLKAHIINYAKTRPVYDAYRKTGYSKHFLETHRTEITLHKAAKAAFDESNLKTLPKVKELDAEYSKLLIEKKALYPGYRKAKEEMQELLRAQKNIELFFDEEKKPEQTEHSR